MRIFLSWSPVPPDPHFWKWMPVEGIVVSIALLKKKRILKPALLTGLHQFLGYNGQIFLDSGSYEDSITGYKGSPSSPSELIALAKWLGVEYLAHLDTPFVGHSAELNENEKWMRLELNILNAQVSNERMATKDSSEMELIYVIQGWDEESLVYCSKKMKKLNANYYGLGSLHGLTPEMIIKRVKTVRRIIGVKPKLHLFAVTSLQVLKHVHSSVDSVDSSTASIAGAMKEIFDPFSKRHHIDNVTNPTECSCPICKNQKGAILIMGKEGLQNYYNKLRKIHNAYHLIENLQRALPSERKH